MLALLCSGNAKNGRRKKVVETLLIIQHIQPCQYALNPTSGDQLSLQEYNWVSRLFHAFVSLKMTVFFP